MTPTTQQASRLHPGLYAKSIIAFFAPMLLQLQSALQTAGVSLNELLRSLVISFITALLVWAVPNKDT